MPSFFRKLGRSKGTGPTFRTTATVPCQGQLPRAERARSLQFASVPTRPQRPTRPAHLALSFICPSLAGTRVGEPILGGPGRPPGTAQRGGRVTQGPASSRALRAVCLPLRKAKIELGREGC